MELEQVTTLLQETIKTALMLALPFLGAAMVMEAIIWNSPHPA